VKNIIYETKCFFHTSLSGLLCIEASLWPPASQPAYPNRVTPSWALAFPDLALLWK